MGGVPRQQGLMKEGAAHNTHTHTNLNTRRRLNSSNESGRLGLHLLRRPVAPYPVASMENPMRQPRTPRRSTAPFFKARPVNCKVLESAGDLGVPVTEGAPTVPKEFALTAAKEGGAVVGA